VAYVQPRRFDGISDWASGKSSGHRLGGCKHRSIQSKESVSIEVEMEEGIRSGSESWCVLRWFGGSIGESFYKPSRRRDNAMAADRWKR
jgi:hypothetical protein